MGTATVVVKSAMGANAYGGVLPGNLLDLELFITGSASYATGGDALTVAAINTAITTAGFDAQIDTTSKFNSGDVTQMCNDPTYCATLDVSAEKVILWDVASDAQVTATTDVSGVTCTMRVTAVKARS